MTAGVADHPRVTSSGRHPRSRRARRCHARPHPCRALRRDRRNRHGQPQPRDDDGRQYHRIRQRARGRQRSRRASGSSASRPVRSSAVGRFARARATTRRSARPAKRGGHTPSASWPKSIGRSPTTRSSAFRRPCCAPSTCTGRARSVRARCGCSSNGPFEGRPIDIHGDGSQIRAWCFIDDMVACAVGGPRGADERSEKRSTSAMPVPCARLQALPNTVVRVTGSSSSVKFVERDEPDVELRIPDVSTRRGTCWASKPRSISRRASTVPQHGPVSAKAPC